MANKFTTAVSRTVHKMGFGVKKHSPEFLVITGVIGMVGAAILACKATTKISKISEEHKEQLEAVKNALETRSDEYSVEDSKKDTRIIYIQTGLKYAKIYAPSVILAAASITCILASHNILKKRNAALAAAYAAMDESFKKYRDRVIERFGENVDKELKYGVKAEEVETTEIDEGSGKSKKGKKTISYADKDLGGSPYAMWFDETTSDAFQRNSPDYNRMFLNQSQSYFNDILNAKGFVFLGDIYEALGIERDKCSQVVGWVKDAGGDDFIDFGFDILPVKDDNGEYEDKIKLDFNVMGNILDLIPAKKGETRELIS